MIDKTLLSSKDNVTFFPLYLYTHKEWAADELEEIPNFNNDIVQNIEKIINKKLDSIELFDYIYGLLNSPNFINKYQEFLRVDFPRVPYPKNLNEFTIMKNLGKRLRELHTMEHSSNWTVEVGYPIMGSNVVEKVEYKNNRVYINESQYFDNIHESAFNYYIGGYQPAQKWLKDRKSQKLAFEDIRHYQEIIYSLSETYKTISQAHKE